MTDVREGRVVGIGASAGGLESLEQLFATLPHNTGMAFVVVQHLSPDFRSLMGELLARHSEMPVHVAEDGMPVEPDHVYVMPPGKDMIIRNRRLTLTDKEPHTFSLPIDAFFRSLAQDVGAQAIAVVLSGSGSDGSRGIVDVHAAGGLVVAESSHSAKFDGMPLSAAATNIVDHILTPKDIARLLCGLPPSEQPATAVMSEDPTLDGVLRLLRDTFGIDFSLYKMTTVGRRIQRRIDILHIDSLQSYAEHLHDDPDELNKLYQDLLIGVTQFFRDPDAFALLEHEVIEKLIEKAKPDEELRVWVAGCATGEEAYSIAMLFVEAYQRSGRTPRVKILATDVHQRSLDFASVGIYGEEQLANVSAQRLAQFFVRRSTGYQISPELRQLIVFARHNLTKDAPFTKMHLISCRNMLIYLQPQAQRTVLSLFHFGLCPQGYLFLGASETPGALAEEFTILHDHWKLYRKRRDVQLLANVQLPMLHDSSRKPTVMLQAPRMRGPDPQILATYDQLLDQFMPPGFLLDEEHVLVDCFAGAEKMLRLRRRRPTTAILELLEDDLRTVVSGAIQRAEKDKSVVSYPGVRVMTEQGEIRCTVTAQPLMHPRTAARNILVTFRDMTPSKADTTEVQLPLADVSRERMSTLESELAYTRETLQATIEELETSNEEMQATNEELVASNEELQSTNEELHSVNEELYTVNAEYQQKILELKELNADMSHLLEGTDVGTVFLDRELRIRRFTSRIASVFRFQSHDVGRQIVDFSHNIVRPKLMEEIHAVRHTGAVVEDEVRDRAGTPYFLRILPYRVNGRGKDHAVEPPPIDGVVLTLTDMTALDKARTRADQLSAIVESSDDAIFALSLEGLITTWNRGAEAMFGYRAEEICGQHILRLTEPSAHNQIGFYLSEIEAGHKVEHVAGICLRKDGTRFDVMTTLSPMYNHGSVVGAAVVGRDITRLVETRRALEDQQRKVQSLLEQAEESARMRERFLAMLSHELRNPLAAVLNASTALREARTPQLALQGQAVIERQARQMKRLLDDILDVSRITSDKFGVRREAIDLREPISIAIESTVPLFAERRVKLETEIPDGQLPINGDSGRLTQVVANLLSNAATYSPPDSTVKLSVLVQRSSVRLSVIDHGVGIEPGLQPRIFDLFVQAEQQLDRPRGGLGVGLSLAKSIVELHGGTIAVRSDGANQGSEFTVMLPLGGTARERAQSSGLGSGPCRIVLVDDQEDSREMLKILFESRNHQVFDAADGANALKLVLEHMPDVAFIDIGLPVMNGFEVAQQIRKRPELDKVVLVALTGYGGHADVDAARAAGFDEHVTKPAELKTLEQILARRRDNLDDA